ncbi:AAA family ATPase [Candidatus Liberibacter sp.]|uniref:AAA family ATPase n=1 Tax=Candidatus Liberibacter sp. TaxID=34022 RepID=UPI0015F785C0|nr:AAA family ATPase [Candidatus Liberibacter sp.]MBA5723934.1 AAA family ATPase [Candidatus Liberibacter sp.]
MSIECDPDKESTDTQAGFDNSLEGIRLLPRISVHVFYETETLCSIVEKSKTDRRMSRISMRLTKGSVSEAVKMFSSMATPGLIILQIRVDSKEILKMLEPLSEVCDPETKVIIVGSSNDVSLYRELIRNGISEYLVEPFSAADLIKAMGIACSSSEEASGGTSFGRSIVFIGSKGGSGSSTIAHNCAFNIASIFDLETILADLDLPYGTANINFDQDPIQGISEAIYSSNQIDHVFIDRLLVRCAEKLSLLAAPSSLVRTYDFDENKIISILDVLQGSFPITIFDMPHIWNIWTRAVLVASDKVVITTSPDLASLRNAKNIIDVLGNLRPNDQPPYLVLNQVGMPSKPEISIEDFCGTLGIKPAAVIPFDSAVFGAAANSGRMISEISSNSSISNILVNFVHILTDRVTMEKPKSGIYDRIKGLLRIK